VRGWLTEFLRWILVVAVIYFLCLSTAKKSDYGCMTFESLADTLSDGGAKYSVA